jgi:hypothetical protein
MYKLWYYIKRVFNPELPPKYLDYLHEHSSILSDVINATYALQKQCNNELLNEELSTIIKAIQEDWCKVVNEYDKEKSRR